MTKSRLCQPAGLVRFDLYGYLPYVKVSPLAGGR